MKNINDFDVWDLATWFGAMYLGSMFSNCMRNYMKKQKEFIYNMTFAGGVMYANRMEG